MTEDEIRAEAVREAAAYLERIYKRGLQSRDSLLADLDSVAFRMEQGMTARGNMRRPESTDPHPTDASAPADQAGNTSTKNHTNRTQEESMTTQKFRKKPVEIEAAQFHGSTSETYSIYQWIEKNTLGSFEPMSRIEGREPWPESGVTIDPRDGRMVIATLEGGHWVNLGDYVIRGVQGEFYPCKPDIFEQTYEPVPESTETESTEPKPDRTDRDQERFRALGGLRGESLCPECHGEITSWFCERCGNVGKVAL